MSGSLLSDGAGANELIPLWRDYWSSSWDRTPDWPALRLKAFMNAEDGRRTEFVPASRNDDPKRRVRLSLGPVVQNFPDGTGPFLGVMPRPRDSSGVLQFNEAGHLLTVAPTRTGKGTSHIIPNLLLYAGSVVVIDIKGENADITADFRSQMFDGAAVWKFAPFDERTDHYNPLDFIRSKQEGGPTIDTFDDARLVASMLIPGNSREPYWDIEARNIVTMLLLYVATFYPRDSSDRTMAEVARLLFRREGGDDEKGIKLTTDEIFHFARAEQYEPLLALVSSFRDHDKRLRDNIVSTCKADMQIWTSERLQRATAYSDFCFDDLKKSMCRPTEQNPAPTSLYIIIPPEHLQNYRAVLRLMVGLGTIELTREGSWKSAVEEGWREKPPCPVLFLLDELPALGHMEPIVNGLSYLAGYGVQLWSFAQNLGQLKEIYGEAWHNFPANAAVSCFFGVNDLETAEFVSRQLGETEEFEHHYTTHGLSTSESSSHGSSQSSSLGSSTDGHSTSMTEGSGTSETENVRFVREPLARASDVRATHKDLQYVFIRNRKPILATKLDYFNFPLFERLYGKWRR